MTLFYPFSYRPTDYCHHLHPLLPFQVIVYPVFW